MSKKKKVTCADNERFRQEIQKLTSQVLLVRSEISGHFKKTDKIRRDFAEIVKLFIEFRNTYEVLKRPNKKPEAPTPAVMPAADAPVAKAIGVAHL